MTRKTRLVVIEDHPIFLKGLISLLSLQPEFEVVAEASDRRQALEAIDNHAPDVALVDLSLGEDSGLNLIKDILHRAPVTRILVLSMHEEAIYWQRALAAGALGFCYKGQNVAILLDAIATVAAGRPWRNPKLVEAEKELKAPHRGALDLASLSDRELEVFQLIGAGMGTAEIGAQLHISVKTVDTYKGNLKGKLNCSGSQELRRLAVEWVANERKL